MKCKFPLFFVTCFCFFTYSFAHSKDTLLASGLHPIGRFARDSRGSLELISSAVHFGFQFNGNSCRIYAFTPIGSGHNYLQYTVDGVYQKRIQVSGNKKQFIIDNLKKGIHIVWIYKATEASTGPVFIEKIIANDIRGLKIPDLPIIEFIGNSITCGAAADPSEIPCGSGEYQDQHNAYLAYGPRLARKLGMNYILSSVSGIGIYRNWNSLSPTMPDVYEKTDFQDGSKRDWDFKTYIPDIVSIALGTNDFSDGDGVSQRLPFDSALFVNTYIGFIELVKSKYPHTQIVLLSSPMINGGKREKFQNCLVSIKNYINSRGDSRRPVKIFFFKPMQAHGCSGHPDVAEHEILAEELFPFFEKVKRGRYNLVNM